MTTNDPNEGLPPRFLVTRDAARFLGVSMRTMEKHRTYGTGPIYRKLGGRIVYSLDDLKEWAADGLRRSTSEETGSRVFAARPLTDAEREQL